MLDIKRASTDRQMSGKGKIWYRWMVGLTYAREEAEQKDRFLLVLHPLRKLQE